MDEEEALDDSIYSEIAAVDKAFLEVIEGQPADSFARKVTQCVCPKIQRKRNTEKPT